VHPHVAPLATANASGPRGGHRNGRQIGWDRSPSNRGTATVCSGERDLGAELSTQSVVILHVVPFIRPTPCRHNIAADQAHEPYIATSANPPGLPVRIMRNDRSHRSQHRDHMLLFEGLTAAGALDRLGTMTPFGGPAPGENFQPLGLTPHRASLSTTSGCTNCNLRSLVHSADLVHTLTAATRCRGEAQRLIPVREGKHHGPLRQQRAASRRATWLQRIEDYQREIKRPAFLTVEDDRVWFIGNNYAKKADIYGGFPGNLLRRIAALMRDRRRPLHLFAGKVDLSVLPGEYARHPPRAEPNLLLQRRDHAGCAAAAL
jgi:hypothetical protein